MMENDLLEVILQRLAKSERSEELFSWDETQGWPTGVLETLLRNGFLRTAEPAKSVLCDGCEEYCPMPVESFSFSDNAQKFFIFCDKPVALGRFDVHPDRLKQWKMNAEILAKKLATMLGFDKMPKPENQRKIWALGIFKGKKRKAQITLTFAEKVLLQMGGYEIPLHEMLCLHQEVLKINSKEIIRLIDKPVSGSCYKPSTAQNEQRKRNTKERNTIIQESYREWSERQPGKTDKWYSIQIAKELKEQRYKISSETVRRNLKK